MTKETFVIGAVGEDPARALKYINKQMCQNLVSPKSSKIRWFIPIKIIKNQ